ncbi:MAG: hypothetical protein IPN71_14900 [Fibrobacteres bacterium]|nr:hypothetical protein [Fibrobacterota bacterium]
MPPALPKSNPKRERLTDLDQSIKELLKNHPVDTLEFLLPDAIKEWGIPLSWEFLNTATRKHDFARKGYVMDLNVRYTFAKRSMVLVVLIEHWATAQSVNLHRTAHYYLDLLERFPDDEVVPVALVTDLKPARIPKSVHSASRNRVWLHFETLVREVSREEFSAWEKAGNAIAQVLRGAMAGPQSRAEKVFRGADALKAIVSPEEYRNLFTLAAEVGKLTLNEVEEYMKKSQLRSEAVEWLEAHFEAKGVAKAKAEGIQEAKLEDARKMLDHGISWAVITDVTGVKPEDLKKTGVARRAAKK